MTTQTSQRAAPKGDDVLRKPLTTSPRSMATVMVNNLGDAGYRFLFHSLRWLSQVYPARALLTLPQGVGWCVGTWWPWVRDIEGRDLTRTVLGTTRATRRGAGALSAQAARHDKHVKVRWTGSAVAAMAVLIAAALLSQQLGPFGYFGTAYAVMVLIGYQGRDRTQPWLDEANNHRDTPVITVQLLAKVLSSIGIPDLTRMLRDPETKEPSGEHLMVRASRTGGDDGQVIEITLPTGVSAQMVMVQRERVASGLRRADDQVFLEVGEEHSGLLVMTVLDRPASKMPAPSWEVPKHVDVFDQIPVGHSPAGDILTMRLMFQTLLIGAAPDAGKSWALRSLATTLQWDPRVELAIAEMKGTGDLACLRGRAMFYRSGNDDQDLAAIADFLRWLRTELRRRQRIIGNLSETDPGRVPENKITPELSADPELAMPVIVAILDEFHELSESKEHGEAFDEMLDLARQARAVGIILVLSTQRPDAEAISTRMRDMITYRFALRCLSRRHNNMILGDGMAKAGYDATMLSPTQHGTGWLRADKGDPQLIRWGKVTPAESLEQVTAAMAILDIRPTGHAAGQADAAGGSPDDDHRPVIQFIADVLEPGEEVIGTSDIAIRLQTAHPVKFAKWTGNRVTRSLKGSHGLKSADRRVDGVLLKTLTVNEVLAAAGRELIGVSSYE